MQHALRGVRDGAAVQAAALCEVPGRREMTECAVHTRAYRRQMPSAWTAAG